MSAHDLEHEPIPGLPHELPPGETIVWQGTPEWRPLAIQTFKLRWLAIYFAVLIGARGVFGVVEGNVAEGALQMLAMAGTFAGCMVLLAGIAWLQARATIYTVTTRRIVMRIGASLSMSWNLPFKRLASADLAVHGKTGDIVLHLQAPDKVRWLYFWPHVQPGRVFHPRPALRAIGQPERVATLLRNAVTAWAAHESSIRVTQTPSEAAPRPVPSREQPIELAEAGR